VPSVCRNGWIGQLFTPVIAGGFFFAHRDGNGGMVAAKRTNSQGLKPLDRC
jgi:hypothetical protein